jgi:hypothetical protein
MSSTALKRLAVPWVWHPVVLAMKLVLRIGHQTTMVEKVVDYYMAMAVMTQIVYKEESQCYKRAYLAHDVG